MVMTRKKILILATFVILAFMFVTLAQDANAVSETSRKNYTIMSGVTESTIYVTTSKNENVRLHVLRVDKNANVSFKVSSKTFYTKKTKAARKSYAKKWTKAKWGYSKVATQAANYNKTKDRVGTVIAGVNGDYYYTDMKKNGLTFGNLIMEGNKVRSSKKEPYFAVMKNGTKQIRGAKSSTKNVVEAIGGAWLVSNNQITDYSNANRNPRQGIGITAEGDIVLINAEGRDPASLGMTMYDLANAFIQQGCEDAITFDGGGSASFLTKRKGNKNLVFRNVAGDGFIRNVSSSLLVVKNKKSNGKTVSGPQTISMKDADTGLVKSASGVYSYKINNKAQKGFKMINGQAYLFNDKGNGMTKTIKIGSHKYKFVKGKLTSCTDKKAGVVKISFCGAAKGGGQNLLFAYHMKDKVLNIGLNPLVKKNGKMKSWPDSPTTLPWYAYRDEIKKINIGSGVTNIGNNFMFISTSKVFDGTPPMKSKLTSVSIPATVKTIGRKAFFNTKSLKNVKIPASVTKVDLAAFSFGGKGYVKFLGKKPPKFGKGALNKTGYSKVIVKNTKAWKKFVKGNKFKKIGFKKSVKYGK